MFKKELLEKYSEEFLKARYDINLECSKIPEDYKKDYTLKPIQEDSDSFEKLGYIKDHVERFVSEGRNLLIINPYVGTGKTAWACKIAKAYIEAKPLQGSSEKESVLFVFMPDFINLMHQQMNSFDWEAKDKYSKLLKQINNADLVIFDDIASKACSDYDRTVLFTVIGDRLNKKKSSIFTTNASKETIYKQIDASLADRIISLSINIELKDKLSHRKIANEINNFFEGE